jgi:alpha/beta superfamily hydrolase
MQRGWGIIAGVSAVVGLSTCGADDPGKALPVAFPSRGHPEITLEGLVTTPAKPSGIGVALCHPDPKYGGTMDDLIVIACEKALLGAGVTTLRFNFRGVGRSGGEHDEGDGEVADCLGAVDFLRRQKSVRHVAVVGYSFGAYVGFEAARQEPKIEALAALALPLDEPVKPGGKWERYDRIEQIRRPLLFISGSEDDISHLELVRRLADRRPDAARVVALQGADHFIYPPEGARLLAEATRAIVTFVQTAVAPREEQNDND